MEINRVPKFGRTTRYCNTLGEAMMEVISHHVLFAGNEMESPKSRSIAFTLWLRHFMHKFSAIFFCIRTK